MAPRNYWLNLFTWKTWQEFLAAGGDASGFSEHRLNMLKKTKPGDYFLCYLIGVSRFISVMEITSSPFKDESKIWEDSPFPCRVKVKVLVSLTPETAVPIKELKDHLSIFNNLSHPNAWTGHLRGSPAKWKVADGEVITKAVFDAKANPVHRPVSQGKLKARPKAFKTKFGPVIVPESESTENEPSPQKKQVNEHTEIQWLLLKFGSDMGLDVWVAKNDKGKRWKSHPFDSLKNLRKELPLQFDAATNQTIELIDVLWLQGNSIVSAFEIESTTSIYSGLLRLSDLIAMQPNLNIPLFIVAPDDRRDKVISEVNRPTFSRLSPPMYEMCRYISFSSLRTSLENISSLVQYIKPDYLDEISESCEVDFE